MPIALDDAEQLVPHHEPLLAVGRDAEQSLVDLAIGPAHAHLEGADEHRLLAGVGIRQVGHASGVSAARDRDEGLHCASMVSG